MGQESFPEEEVFELGPNEYVKRNHSQVPKAEKGSSRQRGQLVQEPEGLRTYGEFKTFMYILVWLESGQCV